LAYFHVLQECDGVIRMLLIIEVLLHVLTESVSYQLLRPRVFKARNVNDSVAIEHELFVLSFEVIFYFFRAFKLN
jgi:hypothetical protein